MPEATPMPKDMANTFNQYRNNWRQTSRLVPSHSASGTMGSLPTPIENDGNMKWKETVKANRIRARVRAEMASNIRKVRLRFADCHNSHFAPRSCASVARDEHPCRRLWLHPKGTRS